MDDCAAVVRLVTLGKRCAAGSRAPAGARARSRMIGDCPSQRMPLMQVGLVGGEPGRLPVGWPGCAGGGERDSGLRRTVVVTMRGRRG